MDAMDEEVLFVGTAEAEHTEMYLKAVWHIREKGDDVKISTIAKRLNVRQPSVVQMLKKLAPHEPIDHYRHNDTGEDNADAHLKRQVMGREVVVAITNGELDFGPWETIFYGEFDGKRNKRVLVKIIGE